MSELGSLISKRELFGRLAQGQVARTVVVTPNRRLAQALKAEFDRAQAARGLTVWEDADILPLASFVERCYVDALYSDRGGALPLLLADAQAREVWEAAIQGSRWGRDLLDVPQTAARAVETWRLAHAWGVAADLEKSEGTDDARAFAAWAREYATRCRNAGFAEAAVLPDIIGDQVVNKPELLVAWAFDILPPQASRFLSGLGVDIRFGAPDRRTPNAIRTSFASPREELEAAARWARARLETGSRQIGVVIPELQLRRKEVVRVFSRVMRPDFNLPHVARDPLPFNVSLGEPLAQFPIVAFALTLLDFSLRETAFENVSRLIRSPFFGGAEGEWADRARLDARLRREADATLSLAGLIALVKDCPVLRERLEGIFALRAAAKSPWVAGQASKPMSCSRATAMVSSSWPARRTRVADCRQWRKLLIR